MFYRCTEKHSLPICDPQADKHNHWLLQDTVNVVNTCCSSFISAMIYLSLPLSDPNHRIDSTDMSPPDTKSTSLWKKKKGGGTRYAAHQREQYFIYTEKYITPLLWLWNWSLTLWNTHRFGMFYHEFWICVQNKILNKKALATSSLCDYGISTVVGTKKIYRLQLTLSVRTEYIYSVASQATSPAPFKYLLNKYPYWIF
jgi:hypothetical protein